jgi:hypothetical protein
LGNLFGECHAPFILKTSFTIKRLCLGRPIPTHLPSKDSALVGPSRLIYYTCIVELVLFLNIVEILLAGHLWVTRDEVYLIQFYLIKLIRYLHHVPVIDYRYIPHLPPELTPVVDYKYLPHLPPKLTSPYKIINYQTTFSIRKCIWLLCIEYLIHYNVLLVVDNSEQ